MNRAEYEHAAKPTSCYNSTDWDIFLESCKKYARQIKRPDHAEDFAQFATTRKLQYDYFRFDYTFTDYMRESYGDTRSFKHRERIRLTRDTPEDFDFGSIRDDSVFSRPDVLCETKFEEEHVQKIIDILLYDLSFDSVIIYYLYFKKNIKEKDIAHLFGVTEGRISQIVDKMRNLFIEIYNE
jgi:hypothetical protein